jgi:hypothetical protein
MRARSKLLLVVVVVLAIASACGDESPASRGSAVVTLDVFSGVPNPTWAITPQQAADLLGMWDRLDETAAVDYSGDLGYRGVIVGFADGSRIWVSHRVAAEESTATARSDVDGSLEAWIVTTGQATLDPALLTEVLAAIAQG